MDLVFVRVMARRKSSMSAASAASVPYPGVKDPIGKSWILREAKCSCEMAVPRLP